ncbi:TonB-dependent siderophore receptor [Pseudomonas putida]
MRKLQHNKGRETQRAGFAQTLLAASLAFAACSSQALAAPVQVHIPAQPLSNALMQFGTQTHLQVLFSADSIKGQNSLSVDGTMEPQQALEQMLRGTGLHYEVNGSIITVGPAAAGGNAMLLQNVNINAAGDGGGYTPDYSLVAKRTRTATKTDTPIGQTPQSISVVTRKQMDDQAVQDVSSAVRYTPGVFGEYTGSNNTREQFRIRGFSPYVFQDGLMLPYGESGQGGMAEPYGLESVEVLRGPASMLYGQSRPGGLINLTSKLPTSTPYHQLEVQGGSYDLKQVGFDFGGPLDDQGVFSYRLTGLVKDSGTQIDHVQNNRNFIAPAFTWRPDDDTSLTVLANYQRDWGGSTEQYYPASGTLNASQWGRISSDTLVGDSHFDKLRRESSQLGYMFEHHFNDAITFRQNLRYSQVNIENRTAFGNGYVNEATSPNLARLTSDIKRNLQIFNVDNQLESKFNTGALEHTLLTGVDYRRSALDNNVVNSSYTATNPYAGGNGSGTVTGAYTSRDLYQTQKQTGVYLQDQIKLDHWLFTLGGRFDWATADSHYRPDRSNATNRYIDQDDHKGTYRYAVAYLFDNGVMPYFSYSQAFDPQLNTSVSAGTPIFKPTEGDQYELGIKYQPPGQESYITASVYKIKQQNVTTADPTNLSNTIQIGAAESRGFELEGKAVLNKNLDLLASYTYTDSEVTKTGYVTSSLSDKGNELPYTPRQQASAWLDYTFHEGVLEGLGAGIGARYTGELWGNSYTSISSVYQRIQTGNFTLVDAALHYDLGKLSSKLDGTKLALNASNLFDKDYVVSCTNSTACYYGPRRNVIATLSYNW